MDNLNVVLNNIDKMIRQCEQSRLASFAYQDSTFSIRFSKVTEETDCSRNNAQKANFDYSDFKFNNIDTAMDKAAITDISQEDKNEKEDILTIASPFVGTVEFSNQIKLGNNEMQIMKGDVICSVEAMKIYNDIKSPVTGTIIEILVKDCSLVEYDQSILKIRVDKNE